VKEDLVHLDHILECLDWVARHTGEGKDAFFRDRKTQSAVLRELQTMAESTQRLSPALRDDHSEVAWRSIAGLRNILVHDYLGIKLERIWENIERDLPSLRTAVEAMRGQIPHEGH
jgi:uncharacterized protein with HEPN domain